MWCHMTLWCSSDAADRVGFDLRCGGGHLGFESPIQKEIPGQAGCFFLAKDCYFNKMRGIVIFHTAQEQIQIPIIYILSVSS